MFIRQRTITDRLRDDVVASARPECNERELPDVLDPANDANFLMFIDCPNSSSSPSNGDRRTA
jgi:hypothetical protein